MMFKAFANALINHKGWTRLLQIQRGYKIANCQTAADLKTQ